MNLLIFFSGVALGAAFSPFWIMLWDMAKPKILGMFKNKDSE